MVGLELSLAILTLTHTEQEDINAHGGQMRKDLNVVIDEKKAQIQEEKTWVQRFFSVKTFHACVM
jgi:ABC-type branched-subunit amino acid transport system substrate-binding protein